MMPVNITVRTRADLQRVISSAGGGPHYIYILCKPDPTGAAGTPFYVGIGHGARLFSHEDQARDPMVTTAKVEAIRSIWKAGGEVVRLIDSVHPVEPWDREEELINRIGRLVDGTGPLTNAQSYSRSLKVEGVELRKYARDHALTGDVDATPPRFKLRDVRLMAGPREPRSSTSVLGKIFTVAKTNPGVTGEELVRLLQAVDFTGNKSAYTQGGRVSASWLAGYLEGAFFRADCQHLQEYSD